MDTFNIILAISLALVFWGLIRSALYFGPSLLIPGGLEFCSVALIAFVGLAIIFCPYKRGAFDFNLLSKERLTALFFLTGVVAGATRSEPSLLFFAAGAAYPWLMIQIFRLFRQTPAYVYFFPKAFSWFVPLICFLSLLETRMNFL